MFDNIENLKIVSSLQRTNKAFNRIENRANHVFIIRLNGSLLYNFPDKEILAEEGTLMFIPKGSTYSYKRLSDDTLYTSINFQGDFPCTPDPVNFSLENFVDTEYISNRFPHMWNLGTQSDRYKCHSLFYNLLSYLSSIESADYSDRKKFKIIEPAVTYLKEHIYDCSLKTDKLHQLCGVSNTYFRQIFVSEFSMTPQDYIIQKRLYHAKNILDSGDFDSIREVSLSVGYNDPLYFSKAFKKMYGISPSALD